MEKKVSSIAEWINNGRLLEGNERFEEQSTRTAFFDGLCMAMDKFGWMVVSLPPKPMSEDCLFVKHDVKYRLSLKNGTSYRFKKEI